MINKIFFDFFGVICSEVSPYWLASHFEKEEAIRIKDTCVKEADIGLITKNEMFESISKLCNIDAKKIELDWYALSKIDFEIVDLIKNLKDKYDVYLLSNAPAEFLRRILKEYNLEYLFNDIFISSELKIIKPNVEYFKKVLEVTNIDPMSAIMIDDNPSNIEGAIKANIKGIVYQNRIQLLNELKKYLN